MPKRCVFLDRDGVLNKAFVRGGKSYPPDTLEEFTLLPGVEEACAALKKANFLLVVVTNQPDVATGKQQRSTVNAMHARLRNLIPVDDIFTCFHVSGDACDCRKPKPGMIFQASEKHDIDVSASYLVGIVGAISKQGMLPGALQFLSIMAIPKKGQPRRLQRLRAFWRQALSFWALRMMQKTGNKLPSWPITCLVSSGAEPGQWLPCAKQA